MAAAAADACCALSASMSAFLRRVRFFLGFSSGDMFTLAASAMSVTSSAAAPFLGLARRFRFEGVSVAGGLACGGGAIPGGAAMPG